MSVELAASALSRALGLKDSQIQLLLRTGWIITVTTFMLWIVGGLGFLGVVSPYASADEVGVIKGEVTGIKVQLLEQTLFDVRLRQCKAATPESKQFYFERLQEKMNEYYRITNRNYRPPSCAELQ